MAESRQDMEKIGGYGEKNDWLQKKYLRLKGGKTFIKRIYVFYHKNPLILSVPLYGTGSMTLVTC